MSCSPPMAWITDPEQRKRRALKKAWVNRWNTATQYAPTPSARNMYPSWLTVEYANTRLISFCTSAMVAARIAVNAPTDATTVNVLGVRTNSADERATMYTPAVTIVAAWISADTGVGPSIASGSQTYRGNCADLPVAPMNSSTAMMLSTPKPAVSAWNCPLRSTAFTSVNFTVPRTES